MSGNKFTSKSQRGCGGISLQSPKCGQNVTRCKQLISTVAGTTVAFVARALELIEICHLPAMSGATYANIYGNRRNHNDYDPISPAAAAGLSNKALHMTIYTSKYVTKAVITHIKMAHPALKLDIMSCGKNNERNP